MNQKRLARASAPMATPIAASLALTFAAPLAAVTLLTAGCTKPSGTPQLHKEPNIELIQDMMESPALKAQTFDTFDREKAASRLPPEHTVPVGYKPYPYHLDPATAAKMLKNPLAGDQTAEVINLGHTKFETYCAVCHGYQGKGDGPVSVKMSLKPPPLISDKIMGVTDGAIFHIISDGQGAMSSYAYQLVNERDRWAIVNYVRSLQKQAKANGETVKGAAGSSY
jgi:mono/diheme cytochrome c family protein